MDDLTQKMQHAVAALGPLNLFAIMSGIHSMVFQYQSFFSAGHLLLRTHNALRISRTSGICTKLHQSVDYLPPR
ncbi:putative C2H2 transcription factor [Aspergillus clavatus NRRL 1]|uniref:Uncharacterized protein n=1 Tax=Aspergillus clavatus (strain ATCC 1007 / CBS 513.65 / DSM 816 / NCTC 3887 / NRRL 1 / QM 1276 / 107) TaxID=344612 RepID=A1C8X5_ASPCL|nr:uncharacterized protein ACLA_044820 [Aspergillus clavatus NRRL 1]EAW13762.1 hypothetical protein ACLA_044820 [Aspergillus clavatus NRRL 1]